MSDTRTQNVTLVGYLALLQVLLLIQGCTLVGPRSEKIGHGCEPQATALSEAAIEHAKAGNAQAFTDTAQLALEACERAHQQNPQPHLAQAVTRLKAGIEYGKQEQVDKGQRQVSKALQQIQTRVVDANPNDRVLGPIVVGQDRAEDIQRKLGNAPCEVPAASKTTISYFYNVNGRAYLRLEVADTVEAATVSVNPPLTDVCYAPVLRPVVLQTGKGIQLGTTAKEVTRLYGRPATTLREGPLLRYRYEAMLDRPYEWDVLFRNDRLVEWTVAVSE